MLNCRLLGDSIVARFLLIGFLHSISRNAAVNRIFLAFALVILSIPNIRAAEPATAPITEPPPRRAERREPVINFSLLDYRGKYYELRRADADVVVLYFVGLKCPIARQSINKLEALQAEFKNQRVALWLINAMPQDDPKDQLIEIIGDLAARGILADLIPRDGPDAANEIRRARTLSNLSGLMPRKLAVGDKEDLRQTALTGSMGVLPLLRDDSQLVTRHFGVTRTCETIAIDRKTMTIFYRGAIDDQMTPGAQKPQPTENYLHAALTEFLAGNRVSKPYTTAMGCLITFDPPAKKRDISYSREIAPILAKKCVGCHSPGNIGPFALDGYEAAKHWSAMMEEVVLDRRMPPWDADPRFGKFSNDRSLTPTEARDLLQWIEQDSPRGDGADPLAAAAPPAAKWALGEPDFTVPLPSRQEIPATGVLDYRYLDSDFVMPRDAWLRAAIVRPDNPKVVHHSIVRLRYPAGFTDIPSESYLFTTWRRECRKRRRPRERVCSCRRVASSTSRCTTRPTANRKPIEPKWDSIWRKSGRRCNFRFAPVRRATSSSRLESPTPGIRASIVLSATRCSSTSARTCTCAARGSSSSSSIPMAGARRNSPCRTTTSIGKAVIGWPNRNASPPALGFVCTGGFDNSPNNPTNPDPTKHVKFGLQTWDEMFMGFMMVADIPAESAAKK